MPYKISGTKSETARVIIFKESDWSIESNTVISGSGAYEVDSLETGDKLVVARTNDGELLGYGSISSIEYTPPGARGIFAGGTANDTIDYVNISNLGDATDFGNLLDDTVSPGVTSNGANGRAVIGGGGDASYVVTNVIAYITILSTGNATDFGDLTVARNRLEATSNA